MSTGLLFLENSPSSTYENGGSTWPCSDAEFTLPPWLTLSACSPAWSWCLSCYLQRFVSFNLNKPRSPIFSSPLFVWGGCFSPPPLHLEIWLCSHVLCVAINGQSGCPVPWESPAPKITYNVTHTVFAIWEYWYASINYTAERSILWIFFFPSAFVRRNTKHQPVFRIQRHTLDY